LPHCCESGVEIAQRLFWQKKMQGAFHTPAKFIPVWKSFSDVVPSPNHVTATRSSSGSASRARQPAPGRSGAERRADRDPVDLGERVVDGHLAAERVVVGVAVAVGDELVERRAAPERRADDAVAREEPVVPAQRV
jgi:hypothetical protein